MKGASQTITGSKAECGWWQQITVEEVKEVFVNMCSLNGALSRRHEIESARG